MSNARMIPEHLAEEYRLVGRIDDRRSPNIVLCVETTRTRRRFVLKLPARSCLADDAFLDALSRRAADPGNRLATPFRVGRGRDGRFFTIAEHCPAGSLRACLAETGRLPEAAIRPLVRDLAAGLAQLHGSRDGRRIVHCDVKPSNVLIARRGNRDTGGWEFRLSDFDSAVLTPLADPAPLARTVGYAAPEACGSVHPPDPAMDYWSLGMLVLTGVRGRHPFDGLPDDEVRKLLVTDWQVDAQYLSDVPDEACRALLGGLMQRNPADRWGETQVRRWLDGDVEVIVSGLRGLGEGAAPSPFFIGGEACCTAGNTTRALLRSWDTGALYGDAFPPWLRALSSTAASCAVQARALHQDAGLLHFCRTLYPGGPERMPAVWRGEPVSASRLSALAGRAGRGDDGARTWLLEFLGEGGGADTLAATGFGDVAALVRSIRDTHREYARAWREIVGAGAPSGSAPSEDDTWVHAVLIACSPDAARSMPRELFDPLLILQRADWFFTFGTDPDRLDPSRRFVLRQLHRASLVLNTGLAAIDECGDVDPQALREGIASSDLQRRLLRTLVVRAGARIATLAAGDTCAPERPPPRRLTPVEGAPGVFRRPARPRASPATDALPPAGEPALTMRIVRLDVVSRPPSAADDEIYLALIAWSGAAPGACLTVHGIDALVAVRRLRIPVGGNDGRMLLVVDGSIRVELRSAGSSRAERRRSIRILVRRRSRTPLRHLTQGVLAVPRHGLRGASGPIRKARGLPAASRASAILHAVRPAAWPASMRPASSWRHAGGLTVLPSRTIAKVAAGTRQRRYASSCLKLVASQPEPRSP